MSCIYRINFDIFVTCPAGKNTHDNMQYAMVIKKTVNKFNGKIFIILVVMGVKSNIFNIPVSKGNIKPVIA